MRLVIFARTSQNDDKNERGRGRKRCEFAFGGAQISLTQSGALITWSKNTFDGCFAYLAAEHNTHHPAGPIQEPPHHNKFSRDLWGLVVVDVSFIAPSFLLQHKNPSSRALRYKLQANY